MLKLSTLTVIILSTIHCKNLPAGITRCAKSAPNFNECFAKSLMAGHQEFARGRKSFGLVKIDPLAVEKLDFTGKDGDALRQIYTNATIKGLTNINITSMDADFKGDQCYMKTDNQWPEINMSGGYSLDGDVSIQPIAGHVIRDMVGKMEMHCEKVKKCGKVFIRVQNFTLDLKPDNVVFAFEKIKRGNATMLSEEMLNALLIKNAQRMAEGMKAALEASFAVIYRQIFNGFFGKVPEKDLFLP